MIFPGTVCITLNDVIMSVMASQITSPMIVYSTVYSGTDQRKYQILTSLAFVRGIHRSPVNSPHKGPVTRKMFPLDDVIIIAHHVVIAWLTHRNVLTTCMARDEYYCVSMTVVKYTKPIRRTKSSYLIHWIFYQYIAMLHPSNKNGKTVLYMSYVWYIKAYSMAICATKYVRYQTRLFTANMKHI